MTIRITADYLRNTEFTEVMYKQGYAKNEVDELLSSFLPAIQMTDSQQEIYSLNDFPIQPDQIRASMGDLPLRFMVPAYDMQEVQATVEDTARTLEIHVAECNRRREEELERLAAIEQEKKLAVIREQERLNREARQAEEQAARDRLRAQEIQRVAAAQEAKRAQREQQKMLQSVSHQSQEVPQDKFLPPLEYTSTKVPSSKNLIELIAYLEYVIQGVGEKGAQYAVVAQIKNGYFGVQNVSIDPSQRQIILDAQGTSGNEALRLGDLLEQLRMIQADYEYGQYMMAIWGGVLKIHGVSTLQNLASKGIIVIQTQSSQ